MKRLLRRFIPRSLLRLYHLTIALAADRWYGHPSGGMVVVGVTGTKGKSTTAYLIARMLEGDGKKVGMTSTAIFKIADREWLNPTKMTMLGRFATQRMLRDMRRAGCTHAVVETSSEGIAQSRHRGIEYDVAVFTNLSPEHIEAHGSFEAYRAAKGELFRALTRHPAKTISGVTVPRTAVVNVDDEYAGFFLGFPADRKIGFGIASANRRPLPETVRVFEAKDVGTGAEGSRFTIDGVAMATGLVGDWNVRNAIAAVAAYLAVDGDLASAGKTLAGITGVSGRLERIEGDGFLVVVDYAHELASFQALFDTLRFFPHQRVVHVFGATGGGRDSSRRPLMGEFSVKNADAIIITTDDPYDDDPAELARQVTVGAERVPESEWRAKSIRTILDRKEAIRTAIGEARADDLILITGKGSEQAMVVARGRKVPWDDRKLVREALRT